jgi:hypothetical protein
VTQPGIIERQRRPIIIGAAVVALGLVIGLLAWALRTGGPDDRSATAPGAGPPASATPGRGPGGGPAPGGSRDPGGGAGPGAGPVTSSPGRVDDATAGFLTELGAIEPGLVNDPARAGRAGEDTCQDLKAGMSYDAVVDKATTRFRTPAAIVDKPRASLIVDAARNHLCPG